MGFGDNLRAGWYEGVGSNPDPFNTHQLLYYGICKHFLEHPSYQYIASFYGSASNAGGAGINAPGRVWPPGQGAFTVFRATEAQVPYDIALCLNYYDTWPSGTFNGASGVSVQIAYHSSSAAWNASQTHNGTDFFVTNSASPWKSASLVFPYTNRDGGGGFPGRTNVRAMVGTLGANFTRGVFFVSDDEGTYVGTMQGGDRSHMLLFTYFGTYQANSGSGITVPLCLLNIEEGGGSISILNGPNGPGVMIGKMTSLALAYGVRDQNYNEETREKFNEHPVILYSDDGPFQYNCGTIPTFRSVPTSTSRNHLYNNETRKIGTVGTFAGANLYAYSFPWVANTYPKVVG